MATDRPAAADHPRRRLAGRLARSFLNGLILLGPVALTAWICWLAFVTVDGWLRLPVPGVGFLLVVALVTLFGFLASSVIAQGVLGLVESTLNRLPFVRLLYTAIKDVLGAFVGEQRRFDQPVLVALVPGGTARAIGFVTQESLAGLGLDGHVAVYLPQSYNFAGQTLVVPREQVTPLEARSADVMAFVVSGGVSGMRAEEGT